MNNTSDNGPERARERHDALAPIDEIHRERHNFNWLEQSLKDAKFAVRSLWRARGFTLTVLVVLALGAGVATVVFDLTAWILIFDQPYPHPEQLFLIGFKDKHSSNNRFFRKSCGFELRANGD